MNVRIDTNCEVYKNELEEVIRAFSPYLTLDEGGDVVGAFLVIEGNRAVTTIKSPFLKVLIFLIKNQDFFRFFVKERVSDPNKKIQNK